MTDRFDIRTEAMSGAKAKLLKFSTLHIYRSSAPFTSTQLTGKQRVSRSPNRAFVNRKATAAAKVSRFSAVGSNIKWLLALVAYKTNRALFIPGRHTSMRLNSLQDIQSRLGLRSSGMDKTSAAATRAKLPSTSFEFVSLGSKYLPALFACRLNVHKTMVARNVGAVNVSLPVVEGM